MEEKTGKIEEQLGETEEKLKKKSIK